MIKKINKELVQGNQMVVIKYSLKISILFVFTFVFLSSCNNNFKNKEVLLKSISNSNEHYIEYVKEMRINFDDIALDQPIKYGISYKKVQYLEKDILEYYNLEDIKVKTSFIKSQKPKIIDYLRKDSIDFMCLELKGKDNSLFDLIAKNDLDRMLYLIYQEYHFRTYSIY